MITKFGGDPNADISDKLPKMYSRDKQDKEEKEGEGDDIVVDIDHGGQVPIVKIMD